MSKARALSVGSAVYSRTTAEIAAAVTPVNYAYPERDVRRYGASLAGSAAIQNSNIKTDTKSELAISGASPYVCGYRNLVLTQGGATNVTNFLGGHAGQLISIRFGDGNSTVKATNIYLAGAVDMVGTGADQLLLQYDGTNWREISRSVN